MRKITVNNQPVTVDKILKDYEILKMESSNVDYYGTDGNNVFIQFKNGASYLYLNVKPEHIEQMKKAESIGRFIGVLSKQYQYTKIENQLVVLQEEVAK
jgi:hypothetical protein